MADQEGSVLPSGSKSLTVPKEEYENIGSSKKREGPIRPTGSLVSTQIVEKEDEKGKKPLKPYKK